MLLGNPGAGKGLVLAIDAGMDVDTEEWTIAFGGHHVIPFTRHKQHSTDYHFRLI
jgi:hypothetical protein